MAILRFAAEDDVPRLGAAVDGTVYDLSAWLPADPLPLLADGRLADPGFMKELGARAANGPAVASVSALCGRIPVDGIRLLAPYDPPEIWGVGVTYERTARLHEDDLQMRGVSWRGLYDYVYSSRRPEIFFKGLRHHAVGPHGEIGIRRDSEGTIVEAELGCVFDRKGNIVAYTAVNDVTAWDIERENPLFLSYAKIFRGSCAFGPVLVPAYAIPNPRDLAVECRIERGGREVFSDRGHTSHLRRSIDELARYLFQDNLVAGGALLATGTAVGVPHDFALEHGDVVTITVERIGTLVNHAIRLSEARHSMAAI